MEQGKMTMPVHSSIVTATVTVKPPDAKTSGGDGREMACDEIAEFMASVVPWPGDGTPGYVNLHWRTPNPNAPTKDYWHGKPVQTVDEFLRLTKWALNKATIKDIYFCLSLQSQIGKSSSGNTKAVRSKENSVLLKALWLDIDIKEPPKGYASLTEALDALEVFIKSVGLPPMSAVVGSGGGLHCYWISDRPLKPDEWCPYAEGLKAAAIKFGLRCDAGCTTDRARVLRVPETFNYKTDPRRPVKLLGPLGKDYDFAKSLAVLAAMAPVVATVTNAQFDLSKFPKKPIPPGGIESLAEGIAREEMAPLAVQPITKDCAFIREALATGGKNYSEPMWNLTTLAATFFEDGNALAHQMGCQHPGYTRESTEEKWAQKLLARAKNELGWPSCTTIQVAGCSACATCQHFAKGKSPLNLAYQQQTPPAEPSFVDPYAEFGGPEFPLDVLPPTLAKFVDAEHRAMGADPSAIAMAALTTVAGAMHAETLVRAGEGWWEKPILWTALVGLPSTMKSPIIDKATKPLSRIDHERAKRWKQENATWQQNQK